MKLLNICIFGLIFLAVPVISAQTAKQHSADADIQNLSHSEASVRLNAVINLGNKYKGAASKPAGSEKINEVYEAVKKLLDDSDTQLRRSAARSLEKIKPAEVSGALRARIGKEADRGVRVEYIRILGAHKSELNKSELIKLVNDPDPIIRAESVYALGGMDYTDTYHLIVKALDDEAEGVRVAGCDMAGKLKIKSAAEKVVLLLGDGNSEVRLRAAQAAAEIAEEEHIADIKGYLQKESDPQTAEVLRNILDNFEN